EAAPVVCVSSCIMLPTKKTLRQRFDPRALPMPSDESPVLHADSRQVEITFSLRTHVSGQGLTVIEQQLTGLAVNEAFLTSSGENRKRNSQSASMDSRPERGGWGRGGHSALPRVRPIRVLQVGIRNTGERQAGEISVPMGIKTLIQIGG